MGAALWEEAKDKEVASLVKHQFYGLIPTTSVPAGSNTNVSPCVCKVKADASHNVRMVVLG